MPWLLELAMALSFLLRHHLEGIIILVLLTFNAIIGQIHSLGSRKTADLLRKKLAVRAKVLRDGKWVIRKSREIVPGDIIAVKLGDIVPADARIVQGKLSVDQSALTGESMPVGAHEGDVIYSGSVVRQGEARCIVVNTGPNTYFGRTAELVSIAGTEVPSGRSDAGHCQIHDVPWHSRFGSRFSICPRYAHGIFADTDVRRDLPYGRCARGSAGGPYHSAGSGCNAARRQGGTGNEAEFY